MSLSILRNLARPLFVMALAMLAGPFLANSAGAAAPPAIAVNVDQARLVKLPSRVATIVVGSPLIADVTLQNGGILVVTGKGYGATNFIAMDRTGEVLVDRQIQVEGPTDDLVTVYRGAGEVLVDRQIQVEGPTDALVTVYRGVDRETYSCMPICQRRMTLGDGDNYFKSVSD